MPALPPVAQVVKLAFPFSIGTDLTARTAWHFEYTGGPPTDAELATFCSDVFADIATDLLAVTPTWVSYLGVEATDLSSPTSAVAEVTGTHTGTRSTTELSAATAVLVNMPIARRYRGGKPRGYWPLLGGSDLSSPQQWTSGAVTAAAGALETFLGHIYGHLVGSITAWTLVNVSYYSGFTNVAYGVPTKYRRVPTPRVTPVVDAVQGLLVNPRPGTQRRRVGLRG